LLGPLTTLKRDATTIKAAVLVCRTAQDLIFERVNDALKLVKTGTAQGDAVLRISDGALCPVVFSTPPRRYVFSKKIRSHHN
jgi:hypothetical protein